jgi:hypothetical protein
LRPLSAADETEKPPPEPGKAVNLSRKQLDSLQVLLTQYDLRASQVVEELLALPLAQQHRVALAEIRDLVENFQFAEAQTHLSEKLNG